MSENRTSDHTFQESESAIANAKTPALILDRVKSVDGAGSGLDADLLDGLSGNYYLAWDNLTGRPQPVLDFAGKATWNDTEKAFEIDTGVTDVVQTLGQELFKRVRNATGSTIANGSVVRVIGATGNRPNVVLAQANSLDNLKGTIGVTTHDIANNSDGFITTHGYVNEIDTSSFSAGDSLYVSPTVAGALTNIEPDLSFSVGTVLTSNSTTGRIDVDLRSMNASTLEGNDAAFYRDASNLNAGTINDARIPSTIARDSDLTSAIDALDISLTADIATAKSESISESTATASADATTKANAALASAQSYTDAHTILENNPHSVTKAQVGLPNVDNTSDLNKPISLATQAALDLKAALSDVLAYLASFGFDKFSMWIRDSEGRKVLQTENVSQNLGLWEYVDGKFVPNPNSGNLDANWALDHLGRLYPVEL